MKTWNKEQADLLMWLVEQEHSRVGACGGSALDALIEAGFAMLVWRGLSPEYDVVAATEAGHARVRELRWSQYRS